jgi:hypothetical protein
MEARSIFPLVAAALLGAVLANLGQAVAEPQPAWDRDLSRQMLRALEAQQQALENSARSQEHQARALQDISRAIERASSKCR